jgi:HTH-type transcriptional repressor of NAD biosynthesis genes
MKTGLTLGKYSPLHKGHQYLIEKAISEMDHVIVVIYNSPETTNIPLQLRADWIRNIYPAVEVIEAWDGPTEIGDTPDIRQVHETYLCKKLGGEQISAFYSSEFYGDHISKALKAKNRLIDREIVNISGTKIRSNPYKYKSFVPPLVYNDFVTNVVFVGAPSTGKTTLSKKLSEIFETQWMPEYGRTYWKKNHLNRRLTKSQLLEIAQKHLTEEDRLIQESKKYIFSDTNATTTFMFGKYYHGDVLPELERLAISSEKRYDLWFLCGSDIPYEDTWDRSGDLNRKWFQYQIESDLNIRKIPYIKLIGDLNQRINRVKSILSKHKKFESIFNTSM